ncbi:Dps family protein [Capnocytophaga stomatis]|uniref:DNA starvation/stationary phase protection protein n=1 Tax=Capnocytophaga stomatis TaxID=1848904 RepID=A0A250G2K1_9FLAO|nr:Dps family protein [Capnocytophaga stomatis]ATA90417.1 DNA starvation/stationary phase protection protein [Capnocytophaga stomatis]GIJ94133.1 DNA starvation/stationary phase protection protein [Capnocytophaga stomatis]GIJ97144.1 DNA starvation/stationary phase protection protein [Capnocytophaga stomatis]GIM49520.1 DNA starvation/stationary phase protection protein [Capnocytophaga stomatis]
MSYNALGLEKSKVENVASELNVLLANFQTYYQNLRGVHWNIKGKRFFELHVKFEELYNAAQLHVDEIAERILTLGFTPFHTFEEYVKNSKVPVGHNVFNDDETVRLIMDSISELLKIERNLLNTADEANDEGTIALIGELIADQEKNIWMLKAYLNETI